MDSKIASNLLPRTKRLLDSLLQLFGIRLDVGGEARNQLTVGTNQELVEVPSNRAGMTSILTHKFFE